MSACRSCGRRIFWAKTEAGKPMPLDHLPTQAGNAVLLPVGGGHRVVRVLGGATLDEHRAEEKTLYMPHWATCPEAKQWKGKASTDGASSRDRH